MTAKPQSVEEFQARLREVSDGLPKRMRQCADYLAANADRVALSTVAELAAGAGVAPSAMMRFCQILGYSGYSEMQQVFRAAVSSGFPDYASRIASLRDRGADSPSALLAEFVDAGRGSLETLANKVDARVLDQAVAALAGARMIHLAGMRRAFPVSAYLAYAFEKMGHPAMLHDGVGALQQAASIREGDALIATTFTPYSGETVDLIQSCADRGIPVVVLTDSPLGPVQSGSVLTLPVAEADVGAFRALSATHCLAITLAVAVGAAKSGGG